MISGLPISYVITERRSYSSVGDLYVSRYARLWTQYVVFALLTLLAFYVFRESAGNHFFAAFKSLDGGPAILLALSNTFLFGQDWLMFGEIARGTFAFSSDFRQATIPAYDGLLTPQTWTLGVELSFYVIAPFILPRRWLMAALLVGSIAVRLALVKAGVGMTDPWTYRFFPAELLFFLVGAFMQQIVSHRYQVIASRCWDVAITAVLTALVFAYPFVPAHELLKSAALMGCCALALPALFRFQHGRNWDVAIGDLSYPIYINHILIITLMEAGGMGSGGVLFAIMAAILSILAAVAMNHFIGAPMEKWRNHLKRRSRERASGAAETALV